MRCMKRNQTKMYFANFVDKTPITDEWGNKTGEYEPVYSDPQEFYAYVSPEKSEATLRRYGELEPYDRVLVLDNCHPEITETTRLWIDSTPETRTEYISHSDGEKQSGKRMFVWKLGVLNDGFLSWDRTPGEIVVKSSDHDYIVKRVSKSLNSRVIAIRKVTVDGTEKS